MSILLKRRLWATILACGAGTLFQFLPKGCADYTAQFAVASFDFCSVFNCTGGSFFNVCDPAVLFVDCPVPVTTQNP